MTDFTKPLDDKRLEAARAICDAVFEPDGVVFCAGEENFEIPPSNELNALQTARRVTLADELAQGLKSLYLAYVGSLETARDIIVSLGRDCDSVDTMERGDPALCKARELLARFKELNHE